MNRKTKRRVRFIISSASEEKLLFNEQIAKMYCDLINGQLTEIIN